MAQEEPVRVKQQFIRAPHFQKDILADLNSWRTIFYGLGLIGQDAGTLHERVRNFFRRQSSGRYGGVEFGSVSKRFPGFEYGDYRKFLVNGSGTGKIERLTEEHYTLVTEYDLETARVKSTGPIEAHLDSLIHALVYTKWGLAGFVFHVHSPDIWRNRKRLRVPATREDVGYGTPEIVEEVGRLFNEGKVGIFMNLFAIGSYEDSIVSFGQDSLAAGSAIVKYLSRSL